MEDQHNPIIFTFSEMYDSADGKSPSQSVLSDDSRAVGHVGVGEAGSYDVEKHGRHNNRSQI
jgi:hypothetical protein